MRFGIKADHALRVLAELATRPRGEVVTLDTLAQALCLSTSALPQVMNTLRRAGLITGQRGSGGGFRFRRPPEEITVADVVLAIDGQLVMVGDNPPIAANGDGPTEVLVDLWLAVAGSLRVVLEAVTIADVAAGRLPAHLAALAQPMPMRSSLSLVMKRRS